MKHFSVVMFVLVVAGCGSSDEGPSETAPSANSAVESVSADNSPDAVVNEDSDESSADADGPGRSFTPITFGGQKQESAENSNNQEAAALTVDEQIEKLKPLQVLLGQWRGTTRREYGGFKAVDAHEWIWDLTSQPNSPALVMTSDKSPYLRSARLSYAPDGPRLESTDGDGNTHQFRGEFTAAVRDVPGDSKKLQRTYKLQFTEVESDAKESWQLVFNQQENNRYLMELDRRRGSAAFRRYDTVSIQREGTSFAINDEDYGEKTCIISQGLGTISVSFKGKTYWVCCTGCKAAFEEDPAKWIARAEDAKKESP